MFVPSVEAAKITIVLFEKYTSQEKFENALNPNFKFILPEDYLQEHFAQSAFSDELQELIAEFFFRILKYQAYLTKILNESFSAKMYDATSTTQNNFSTQLVFVYLLVIELNEITKHQIEEILIALNAKMAVSLLKIFKRPDILQKLYEWGCQIWDAEYMKNLLQNIISKPLFEEVYETLTNSSQKIKKNRVKQLTVPVGPKCLLRFKKIKPRSESNSCLPSVTRIPIIIKANKVPSTTYVPPIQKEKIEKAHLRHREQAKKLLENTQKNMFRCANTEKPEKFKEVVNKIEKKMYEVPKMVSSLKEIKPKKVRSPRKTVAVILREGARLLKLEQKEIERYDDLAKGGFNSELLFQWEKEIKEEEFQKHIESIEKKHLEGLLSYEEALLAKQKCLKKKKKNAYEFRKEKEVWMKQLEAWKNEEQLRIQINVEKGKAIEKGVKEAVEQAKEEKHKIAQEVMEKSKALKQQSIKEREKELQRKVQIIKEIKALQGLMLCSLRAMKKKQTDFTKTSNLGLLCEMSIVELKERLFILRLEVQEELQKKRVEIKMRKECRKEIIESYEELIESHRSSIEKQKEKREIQNGTEKKEIKQKSASLESLHRKLYEKRRQRLKLQNANEYT